MIKRKGLISIILGIVTAIFVLLFPPVKLAIMKNILTVELIIALVGILLGILGIKKEKKQSIIGIIINTILTLFILVSITGLNLYEQLDNCVKTSKEFATCELNGEKFDNIPIILLEKEQMKE